jgi:hypothetical protein
VPERPLPKADHEPIAIELGSVSVASHPGPPFRRMHGYRPATRRPDQVHALRGGGVAPGSSARCP